MSPTLPLIHCQIKLLWINIIVLFTDPSVQNRVYWYNSEFLCTNDPPWGSDSNHCTNVIFVNHFASDIPSTPDQMCTPLQRSMQLDYSGIKFGITSTNLAVVYNPKRWPILLQAKIELSGTHPCLFQILMTSGESSQPYISTHAFA